MKNKFWLGIICIFVLSGCTGCKDKTYPTVPISDQRLVQAVDFKPGSYFIYQDSASGAIDSFYGDFYSHTNIFNEAQAKYYEVAACGSKVSINPATNITFSAGGVGSQNILSCNLRYNNIQYAWLAVLKFPFTEGTSEKYGLYQNHYVKYYSSLQVNNISYPNVYEVFSGNNFHSYYSFDSGLVKFSLTLDAGDYHCWTLIKQKIIR